MDLEEEYNKIILKDSSITESSICKLIVEICNKWFEDEKSVSSNYSKDRIWFEYEHKIWKFGEDLRLYLKLNKKLAISNSVQNAISDVIKNNSFGKGRESFVLLVGEIKAKSCKNDLINLLEDDDVKGHALLSLIKLKVSGLELKANKIMNDSKGWIKNAAKTYITKSRTWNIGNNLVSKD